MKVSKVRSVYFPAMGVDIARAIELEGKHYMFGDDVFGTPSYIANLDQLIEFYPLGVKWLLERGKYEKTSKLAVSLPAATYRDHKALMTKGADNVIDRLKERLKNTLGYEEVSVAPQGAIALYHIENINPDVVSDNKTVLLIDGGFNTLNVGLFVPSADSYTTAYVRTYYDEFGVRDLLSRYLAPALKEKYPETPLNEQRLNSIFVSGAVNIGLNSAEITEEKRAAVSEFLSSMFGKIKVDIGKEGLEYQSVAIIGGLAHYIDGDTLQTDKILFIPPKARVDSDGAEFYNVRGMARVYTPESGYLVVDGGFGHFKVIG
jgi:hypothetical protein